MPRLTFSSRTPYPFSVQAGDVLFIAGNPPSYRSDATPIGRRYAFEHVALSAENRKINNSNELLDLLVIGLPESKNDGTADTPSRGLIAAPWGRKRWSKILADPRHNNLSSSSSVWNLGGRVFDEMKEGDACIRNLKILAGWLRLSYQPGRPRYFMSARFQDDWTNNCVGFVCTALGFGMRRIALVDVESMNFPTYADPYQEGSERKWPSPGHVARALTGAVDLPYLPADSDEAAEYATVGRTCESSII